MSRVIEVDHGLQKILNNISELDGVELTVGIQSDAEKPDAELTMAELGAIHEFGAKFEVGTRQANAYRRINKDGSFANGGRFVKKSKSNFVTTHTVGSHIVIIPQRSFMRSTYNEKEKTITQGAVNVARTASNGGDFEQSVKKLGQLVEGAIKRKIAQGPFKPNSPSTIRRKKSSRPLIDTGHMRQSIRYKVRKRGGK